MPASEEYGPNLKSDLHRIARRLECSRIRYCHVIDQVPLTDTPLLREFHDSVRRQHRPRKTAIWTTGREMVGGNKQVIYEITRSVERTSGSKFESDQALAFRGLLRSFAHTNNPHDGRLPLHISIASFTHSTNSLLRSMDRQHVVRKSFHRTPVKFNSDETVALHCVRRTGAPVILLPLQRWLIAGDSGATIGKGVEFNWRESQWVAAGGGNRFYRSFAEELYVTEKSSESVLRKSGLQLYGSVGGEIRRLGCTDTRVQCVRYRPVGALDPWSKVEIHRLSLYLRPADLALIEVYTGARSLRSFLEVAPGTASMISALAAG